MITEPRMRCSVEGLNALAKSIYGERAPAPKPVMQEEVCPACFGNGKTQEQDFRGHYTSYVIRCLCCGGSGRVLRQLNKEKA